MTKGSRKPSSQRRPVLILGLGNPLLGDDGAGLRLLEELAASKAAAWEDAVEFLDGGTQGIALAGEFSGRDAVIILDAVGAGTRPGTIHLLRSPRTARGRLFSESDRGELRPFPAERFTAGPATAHGCNAQELIATAALLGEGPEELFVVGIEPRQINTGIGLSRSVAQAIDPALRRTTELVEQLLRRLALERQGVPSPCA